MYAQNSLLSALFSLNKIFRGCLTATKLYLRDKDYDRIEEISSISPLSSDCHKTKTRGGTALSRPLQSVSGSHATVEVSQHLSLGQRHLQQQGLAGSALISATGHSHLDSKRIRACDAHPPAEISYYKLKLRTPAFKSRN